MATVCASRTPSTPTLRPPAPAILIIRAGSIRSGELRTIWPEIDDGEPAGADLLNPGAEHGAVGCGNGHGERMPIDYLILGERLARRLVPGSYRVRQYPAGGRWPDHCVISIELAPEALHGL